MLQWFHDLKIRYKLIGAFLFIIILTIILSVFTWIGQAKAKAAIDEFINVNSQLVELSYQTQNQILLARKAETDYLLNYRQLGFSKAKETYLTEVARQVDAVHKNMDAMRALAPDDSGLIDATQQIDAAIDEYHTTFLETVNGLELQGYANAGLEGEFTRKIKQVQGVIKSLQNDKLLIDVLQMQLDEKDYLHMRDEKYIIALDNTNKKFIADVNKTDMYESDKKGLTTLVGQYQDLFSQVIEIDADVAAKRAQYQAAVSKLDPLLEGIRAEVFANQAKTVLAVNEALRTAQMIILILSIAVVVIGTTVGLFLSQTISRAVETVSRAATGLAAGNLNQQVAATGADELGTMAQAFARMIAYFKEMATVAEQLARGDLTATVVPLSDEDVLGHAFANMTHTLRELVANVTTSATSVNHSAQQLTEVSEEAGNAAGQVAETVAQVAQRTARQNEHIEQANATVQQVSQAVGGVAQGAQEQASAVGHSMTQVAQISSVVEQVAKNAQTGAEQAAQAAAIAQEGVAVVEKTIAGMTVIKDKVGLSARRVEEMGERSQQIEAIVETIDGIAAQTNLLALNAAIEAARAGEHGKGFAVVADEVRKLAEKSAAATGEIGALIKNIQQTIKEAVTAMTESTSEVENGVQLAGQSGEALHHILEAITEVEQQVTSIAAASQQTNAASQALVQSMESVSAVVEENTASTEEMAAGITEVTDAIANIAEISQATSTAVKEVSAGAAEMRTQVEQAMLAAHDLNQLANELMGAVASFKTTVDDDADAPESEPEMPEETDIEPEAVLMA